MRVWRDDHGAIPIGLPQSLVLRLLEREIGDAIIHEVDSIPVEPQPAALSGAQDRVAVWYAASRDVASTATTTSCIPETALAGRKKCMLPAARADNSHFARTHPTPP